MNVTNDNNFDNCYYGGVYPKYEYFFHVFISSSTNLFTTKFLRNCSENPLENALTDELSVFHQIEAAAPTSK